MLLSLGQAGDDKDGTVHLSNHVLEIINSPQQALSMYYFGSTRFGSSISASLAALHHPEDHQCQTIAFDYLLVRFQWLSIYFTTSNNRLNYGI
ncbi:hypothetical protein NE237_010072 [Protea cynaroides]|uniref:Uncharacterized protein n=1 Tax=Protea cynaroides TaxID=273540 RepID=A0A9Q0KYZ2_9MAGN|nr:hypothetical protein NE237_010072 [Protea cynaroides]